MSNDPANPVLDAQKQHWEGMLASKPEMFGRDPSEPGRAAAADFKAAGCRRVLELGGGQGRDTLFFAAEGLDVHVLDYALPGVDAVLRKAADEGLASRITAAQHDVRRPLAPQETGEDVDDALRAGLPAPRAFAACRAWAFFQSASGMMARCAIGVFVHSASGSGMHGRHVAGARGNHGRARPQRRLAVASTSASRLASHQVNGPR
jgi:hypothetical protein